MQPSNLEHTANRRAWEWLFDVAQRLHVVVELTDDRQMPVFPAGSTPAAGTFRRMLATGEPALAAAMSEAMHSSGPISVTVNGYQALCRGMSHAGVLAIARELKDEASAEGPELELIGAWLADAIAANLTKPPQAIAEEPYRITSLQRILANATARGSVRRVIGAFVEAIGVWDDVLIRVFAAGANGGYFQYVAPVGAPTSGAAELDQAVIPRDGGMTRLPASEIERLGLMPDAPDVFVLRLALGGDGGCLLVFSGAIDDHEQVRLTLYSEMLRESLGEVLEKARASLIEAATRPALAPDDPLDEAVKTSLKRLADTVGATRAAASIEGPKESRSLAVGDVELLLPVAEQDHGDRLVVTSADAGVALTLALARALPFTSFEEASVAAAAGAMRPWVEAALPGTSQHDRRRRFKAVDALFDQLAAEAVDAGQQASVIVVAVDANEPRPDLLQMWLGRIRGQLRAGDFAGLLNERELAVLLCDASTDHATLVSARLKELLEAEESNGIVLRPAFGMTTRTPSTAFEGSLVGAARAGAAAIR